MVKDKGRGAEKLDRENGGVCDHGILSHIKIRVGTAAIFEGNLVFLGIDSTPQDITNNAYVEGGGLRKIQEICGTCFPYRIRQGKK